MYGGRNQHRNVAVSSIKNGSIVDYAVDTQYYKCKRMVCVCLVSGICVDLAMGYKYHKLLHWHNIQPRDRARLPFILNVLTAFFFFVK